MTSKDGRTYALLEKNYGHLTWTKHRRLPDRTGSKRVNKIVLHDPEAHLDLRAGGDRTAEDVVSYARSLTKRGGRDASWHVSTDSDSIISLLPDSYRAWQVHRFSESSLGIEMGSLESDWTKLTGWRVNAILENAARVCGYWCQKHDIPPVILTLERVMAGQAGMSYHGYLDPKRRTDPGVRVSGHGEFPRYQVTTFPETEFLRRVNLQIEWQQRVGLTWPKAWVPGSGR